VETTNYQGTVATTGGYIAPDNAYVQGIAGLAAAVDPTGAYINKDWTSQLQSYSQFSSNVRRATFGLDGQIGDSSWTWDANYEYGLTHHDQMLANNLHLYEADMALDSVVVNGQPECRVTADGFAGATAANPFGGYAGADPSLAQGCVPINPFGNQPLSDAQKAYVFGNLVENLRYEQTDANINASGDYFSGVGAGPFSAAVGYEFRQELGSNIDNPGVPAAVAGDYLTQFGTSFGGIVTVHEGYLETDIPLLKDKPGAHLLEFDVAGRESRYDNRALFGINTSTPGVQGNDYIHNLTTWKASGIWEPVDGFRIRASQSRDARAANFRELYYGQVIGAGGIFGYCGPGGTFTDPCTWNLEGNVNLKPETSDTTTAGIVLTPRDLLPGFQFSADWFHIKINNAIEQANPTLVLQGCKNGIAEYCNEIAFNPGTGGAAAYQAGAYNIQAITPSSYNGAFYDVRGVDFSLNYIADLGNYGTINTRLLTTWMDQQTFANCTVKGVAACQTYSLLGQTGTGNTFLNDYTPDARWRGSLMVTWAQGPLSITPSMSFVSHGIMDYLGVTPSDPQYAQALANPALGLHPMPTNYVPSYFLFNLNGTYTFQQAALNGLQLFVQVNNIFNKTPPFTGGATAFGPSNAYGGTNPIFFDTLGLAYRVGFRLSF
ncbi:MAG: TonB-dependent receptor domain-containing protein, partial [Steroidobacteraceae bacterium]